jgi:hypothetical protein
MLDILLGPGQSGQTHETISKRRVFAWYRWERRGADAVDVDSLGSGGSWPSHMAVYVGGCVTEGGLIRIGLLNAELKTSDLNLG